MYTNICPNCGEKSKHELKDCPNCGYAKVEIVNKNSITKSINDSLVGKLSFLDYPQLYVTIIFRLVILLITIFLIPNFIGNSEFSGWWLEYFLFTV